MIVYSRTYRDMHFQ